VSWSLHRGAEQDIANALNFYREHAGLRVAQGFLNEFERAAKLLVERPQLGSLTTKGRRVYPMRVFPYSIVYRELAHGILIIIVRHQRRKPGFGDARK
jgi:toxin ParE1/3/4